MVVCFCWWFLISFHPGFTADHLRHDVYEAQMFDELLLRLLCPSIITAGIYLLRYKRSTATVDCHQAFQIRSLLTLFRPAQSFQKPVTSLQRD